MSESTTNDSRPSRWGRVIGALCNLFAIGGGLVLAALAVMTVVSVVGRFLFSLPVPGDFELVEIGCAIAVFSFLPYCQFHHGNVVVDFFTMRAKPRTRRRMDGINSLIYGALAGLLTWRLSLGGYDMYRYGEETMILGLDRWWGFIPMVASMALLTLVCLYTFSRQWSNPSA